MRNIRNTIVVMFDSWQFNYTGCYGNEWIKTPHIDALAREGVLFENAYGNNMPTLPVRRSLMTGRFTLHEIGWGPLRPEDTTVADLCWGTGVDTAMAYNSVPMFVSKGSYARSYGKAVFSRGFDNFHFQHDELYEHYTVEQFRNDPGFMERLLALPDGEQLNRMNFEEYDTYLRDKQYWKCDDDHTVAVNIHEAIELLQKADRTHGLHLWIDSWDPHEPWDPPSVWTEGMVCPYDPDYKGADMWLPPMSPVKDLFTEEQLRHIRMLYAEKITLCDKYFGQLLDCVRKLGMWENTLMWLTSDHGEPLGNGEHGHGLMTKCRPWPYEELVHIPLIIRAPGLPAGKRVKGFVQSVDVAPTICDWLGIGVHPDMQGKSLLPLCRGEADTVRDYAIAGYYGYSWSLIKEDWSYIHWLKPDEDPLKTMYNLYAKTLNETSAYLSQTEGGKSANLAEVIGTLDKDDDKDDDKAEKQPGAINDRAAEYKDNVSLDGADQWTCTPGSVVELPARDELYDRRTDPFQIHNVIEQHQDVARTMFAELRDIMAELKAS